MRAKHVTFDETHIRPGKKLDITQQLGRTEHHVTIKNRSEFTFIETRVKSVEVSLLTIAVLLTLPQVVHIKLWDDVSHFKKVTLPPEEMSQCFTLNSTEFGVQTETTHDTKNYSKATTNSTKENNTRRKEQQGRSEPMCLIFASSPPHPPFQPQHRLQVHRTDCPTMYPAGVGGSGRNPHLAQLLVFVTLVRQSAHAPTKQSRIHAPTFSERVES